MDIKDNDFVSFDENGEIEEPVNASTVSFSVEKDIKQNKVEKKPEITESIVKSVDYSNTEKKDYVRATNSKSSTTSNTSTLNDTNISKTSKKQIPQKIKKGKTPYVTKGFMIICLIITIIVSSAIGAGIGAKLGGSSKSHSNLSESSLSKATGSKLTVSQIVAKNADAVVEIVVEATTMGFFGQQEVSEGAGSGVIINKDGYIVTNYHVIDGANKVQVTLHNGNAYNATIVGGDDSKDIAILKINAKNLKVATIGDSSKCAVGDLAVAIGNPLGQLGGTATTGIISALDRTLTIEDRTLNLMQTDAAVNPGNSGGGLFNGAGELIGIVDSKTSATEVEGLAFAIPVNTVKDDLNTLISGGKVSGKPSIGISIYDVSEDNAEYYKLDGEGVYVAEVTGDAAKKAGLKKGDKIISINDIDVEDSEDLIKEVQKHKIGDKVTLKISRDGQKMTIKTALEESVSSNINQ